MNLLNMIGGHFRPRRMEMFVRLLGITPSTTVLDVGGSAFNWKFCPVQPRITILNLDRHIHVNGFQFICGDATNMPFSDHQFDVIFSNSVIEHLSNTDKQKQFAEEVARVGRHYFVQTPDYWFPVEPHYLTPFVQFVPHDYKPWVHRWLTLRGWMDRPAKDTCMEWTDEIRLLRAWEMRALFPEASIVRERVCGFSKSLIAVH
jgi:predicted SAM-dependent methyltransferase